MCYLKGIRVWLQFFWIHRFCKTQEKRVTLQIRLNDVITCVYFSVFTWFFWLVGRFRGFIHRFFLHSGKLLWKQRWTVTTRISILLYLSLDYSEINPVYFFPSPSAALAAADATRGSTTDARKATVLITGFSDWLKGTGWYARGPREAEESSR